MNIMIIVLTMFLALPVFAQTEATDVEPENQVEERIEAEGADIEITAQTNDSDIVEAIPAEEDAPAVTVRQGTEVVNLSDTIVGNQEQPTVLYIVPWKPAEDTTILYLPLSSKAMEHIFSHVERVEHQRQVQYIDQLDKQ